MSDGDGITIRVGCREIDPIRGGVLALLPGLAVTGYGADDYQQQQQALADAVEVDGTIVETGVVAESGSSNPGAEYRPTVTFEYRYDGENYTSHSVFPGETTPNYDTRSAAVSVLDGYETGDTATAYVDPEAPGEAFLLDRRSRGAIIAIAIGAVVALLGVGSLFTGLGP